ncbi:hypothetical protein MKK84_16515 [Methylobacterium sp. E-065]|uniref:hypothetical protein n=1 Tax=Methylobacterium sp. E-065 TaxID=2836583 RepID=UPI001FB980F8|nr:hypothetical protein [Methylobacterium sp. E-065]MCJ2019027.1 hypothetical protein [Methylobacterium sp. E-065]
MTASVIAAARARVFIDMAFSSRRIGSIGPGLNVVEVDIVQEPQVVRANLAAFCQRCHMIHDRPEHQRRRWRTLFRRKAVGDLFDGPYA